MRSVIMKNRCFGKTMFSIFLLKMVFGKFRKFPKKSKSRVFGSSSVLPKDVLPKTELFVFGKTIFLDLFEIGKKSYSKIFQYFHDIYRTHCQLRQLNSCPAAYYCSRVECPLLISSGGEEDHFNLLR